VIGLVSASERCKRVKAVVVVCRLTVGWTWFFFVRSRSCVQEECVPFAVVIWFLYIFLRLFGTSEDCEVGLDQDLDGGSIHVSCVTLPSANASRLRFLFFFFSLLLDSSQGEGV
jgi:hypothetical protein